MSYETTTGQVTIHWAGWDGAGEIPLGTRGLVGAQLFDCDPDNQMADRVILYTMIADTISSKSINSMHTIEFVDDVVLELVGTTMEVSVPIIVVSRVS